MALGAGAKLGHYEIVASLGAGGMGEVYRAHDSRLGRDVAIKVLPELFARDANRLSRFSQEARAVAALNHPNILGIYDVGSQDGVPYLICEFLKGDTLREKLESGALPLRRALDYARQMATGLAAAHERGVVHRDLKPENIFITTDGQVKLLDFGLAKLTAVSDDDRTETRHTDAGTVMGTAGYMSPEQVRGQPVDHRSDIFSLGVVLYEMLSGAKAFAGDTSVEVMNGILKADPPPLSNIPGGVSAVLEHCLQKNPAERFQSARDLAFAISALSSPSQPLAAVTGRRWSIRSVAPYAAIALLILAFGAYAWRSRQTAAPTPAAHADKIAFERLTDLVGLETSPVISPDGKSVAFVADQGGTRQIWVHLTAGGSPLQLTHDAGEHLDPRWSQDSASLLYYTSPHPGEQQGALWEISALGGVPRRLASSISEADISHDGAHIAFFRVAEGKSELVVCDRDGANVHPVALLPSFNYRHPRWSPDDRSIAYEHSIAIWSYDVYVVAAAGGEPRKITNEGDLIEGLAWTPDGSAILYSSSRGTTTLYLPAMHLWLQPLAGGAPRQLTFGDDSFQGPDVGRDGRVVASRRRMRYDVWKLPVTGSDAATNARQATRITEQTGQVQTPTVAPDESAIAFLWDSGSHGNIWVKDLRSGELRQVTHERDANVVLGVPTWSPKGDAIAFATTHLSDAAGMSDVGYYAVQPDGSELRRVIPQGAWASWSPDGQWLYYSADAPTRASTRYEIWKIPGSGGTPLSVRKEIGSAPIPAPDGSLYYIVQQPVMSGVPDYEVRVAKPEDAPSTLLLKIAGQRLPTWQGLVPEVSHNGKWLVFPLNDEYGTNLWLFSTSDHKLHRAVDFSPRRTFIARRVAWSPDDRFIYAAVGEGDADVVSLQGLLQ